ncbi:uncharacterized protein LOC126785286 [Argentina anserina]|uniref:uncharacterized protein LOC126785286 n=1 Tax=Argentina anserina TaxID=57926 RepID=UPI002176352D|nr:uncharacterized protein LOC126785286 [Potentilla anserina]
MLDGLLGRGFGAKCKSLIKLTKSRIDVIRRKRNASQKFLKKDIADLLANGLDINAYGRAEGLTVEVILSSCYDFVERCCDLVLKHLSVMQKQRECPEECKEAVASLMVAAARFSDLPELRDIRKLFQERYGNSLDYCVDQKFVENIAAKPPTLEKKVQLMKDIALEFSIKWDSSAFEQRMSKPPAFVQDKPKTYGSFPVADDKGKLSNGKGAAPKGDRHDHLSTERRLDPNGGHKSQNKEVFALKKDELDDQTRHRPLGKEYKSLKGREGSLKEKEGHGILFQERREVAHKYEPREDAPPEPVSVGSSSRGKGLERQYEADNFVPKREGPITPSHVKPNVAEPPVRIDGKYSFAGKEEGTPKLKAFSNYPFPPPYVKSNVRAKDRKHEVSLGHDSSQGTGISMDPSAYKRDFAENVVEKVQLVRGHERPATAKVDSYDHKEQICQDDIAINSIPKSRSSRKKYSRSRSSANDAGNSEDTEVVMSKPRSRSRRRDDSRRGLQLLFDDDRHHRKDDEERRIDELLLHYSTKPSDFEPGQSRRKSKSRHASRDERGDTHVRSNSLPHEHSGPSETPKVFARASSFQPDGSNARHVHPKLPDYEDLAAKFAALRGR